MATPTKRPDMVPVLAETRQNLQESRAGMARACEELELARQEALRPRRASTLLRAFKAGAR